MRHDPRLPASVRFLFATALIAGAMAMQPPPAAARSATGQLNVTLQVVDRTTVTAQTPSMSVKGSTADAATLALVCAMPSVTQVTLARTRVASPGAEVISPPHSVVCTAAGQAATVAISVPGGRAAAGDKLTLEIAY
jgi:hypothetical protein